MARSPDRAIWTPLRRHLPQEHRDAANVTGDVAAVVDIAEVDAGGRVGDVGGELADVEQAVGVDVKGFDAKTSDPEASSLRVTELDSQEVTPLPSGPLHNDAVRGKEVVERLAG